MKLQAVLHGVEVGNGLEETKPVETSPEMEKAIAEQYRKTFEEKQRKLKRG